MPNSSSAIPPERIDPRIFVIRGERVMIDRDIAELYGVRTEAINQAVKRNSGRFPVDFAFRLTEEEKQELITICDRFESLKHAATPPHAFTEHGVAMLASVLRSVRAVQVSVEIVRAFIRLRRLMFAHADLQARIDALESKYDEQFRDVFVALRQLLEPPPEAQKGQFGFSTE